MSSTIGSNSSENNKPPNKAGDNPQKSAARILRLLLFTVLKLGFLFLINLRCHAMIPCSLTILIILTTQRILKLFFSPSTEISIHSEKAKLRREEWDPVMDGQLAPIDPSIFLVNEADVRSAASLYFLHPVNLALRKVIGEFKVTSDADHRIRLSDTPKGNNTPNEKEGNLKTVTVRTDYCWHVQSRTDKSKRDPFAVLEFKRHEAIHTNEIENANKTETQLKTILADAEALEIEPETEFVGNSKKFLKQAVNYSHKYNTQYVAIFDWDNLVLLVMTDRNGTDGGNSCKMTLIHARDQMRRALLGFLMMAYRDYEVSHAVN